MVSPSSNSYPIVRAIVAFFRREERTTFIIGGTLFANEMASFSPRHAVDVLFGFSTWDLVFQCQEEKIDFGVNLPYTACDVLPERCRCFLG